MMGLEATSFPLTLWSVEESGSCTTHGPLSGVLRYEVSPVKLSSRFFSELTALCPAVIKTKLQNIIKKCFQAYMSETHALIGIYI